jgi:hypothetical protein
MVLPPRLRGNQQSAAGWSNIYMSLRQNNVINLTIYYYSKARCGRIETVVEVNEVRRRQQRWRWRGGYFRVVVVVILETTQLPARCIVPSSFSPPLPAAFPTSIASTPPPQLPCMRPFRRRRRPRDGSWSPSLAQLRHLSRRCGGMRAHQREK